MLILFGGILSGCVKGQPKLSWHTQPELFGTYTVYDPFEVQSAWIENPTEAPIEIESIQTTGTGFLAYLEHRTIPPGGKVELVYTYQPKVAISKQKLTLEVWPKGGKHPLFWRAHPEVKPSTAREEVNLDFNLRRKDWVRSLIEVERMWADETVEMPIQLVNDYESPITITSVHSDSEALTLDFSSGELRPGESLSGKITVEGAALADDRMLSDRINIPIWVEMEVEGQSKKRKLYVWGHWLRKLVPGDLEKMPEITFDSTEIDLGTLISGDPGEGTFSYTNTGVYALQLEMVKTSSGSVTANWNKDHCFQGERDEITFKFNTQGRQGKQRKTCMVRANDHRRQPKILMFKAEIIKGEDSR